MRRPASTPPELPGHTFVRLLGSGGFSDVFLYEQQLPRRRVAVKVLLLDELTPANRAAFVAAHVEHLREFRGRQKLRQMITDHSVHLIGTSGTVTTLAGLHLGLERYERQKVDGLWMSAEEVDVTIRVLLGMPFDRRVAHPCIGRDRADLVLPGCAIFEAIRREWP